MAWENLSLGFQTTSYTNCKMARGLKFWTKGCGYPAADLFVISYAKSRFSHDTAHFKRNNILLLFAVKHALKFV